VAPRTATESALAAIWADLLGQPRVGVHDDFFELGGHSLMALRLVSEVRSRLRVTLPVAALFRAPTIAELAGMVDRGEGATADLSGAVPIRRGGRLPALHLVHAIGGGVLPYAALARHLDLDRPVLGLEAPGLGHGDAAAGSIAALAAHHLATLDDHPLLLGGWSMGGLVAFEMARQLQAGGAPLPTLVLLDPPAPARGGWEPTEADAAAWFAHDLARTAGVELTLDAADLAPLSEPERAARLLAAGALPPETDQHLAIRLMRVFHAHLRALASYRPESPFAGDALLLVGAGGEDTAPAWAELIGGRLEVRTVDADHYAMVRDPDAAAVAALIEAFLH
jgi:thioesterase domain-containing protein/acyl carrier protein